MRACKVAFLAVVFAATAQAEHNPLGTILSVVPQIPGIVGGRPDNEHREVVLIGSLEDGKPKPDCSATLVGDGTLITAAHCVVENQQSFVWLESKDGHTKQTVEMQCHSHPSYGHPAAAVVNSANEALSQALKAGADQRGQPLQVALDRVLALINTEIPNSGSQKLKAELAGLHGTILPAVLAAINGGGSQYIQTAMDALKKLGSVAQTVPGDYTHAKLTTDVALCSFATPDNLKGKLPAACLATPSSQRHANAQGTSALVVGFGCNRIENGKEIYDHKRNEATLTVKRRQPYELVGTWDPGSQKEGLVDPDSGQATICQGDSGGFLGEKVQTDQGERLRLEAISVSSASVKTKVNPETGKKFKEYAAGYAVGAVDIVSPDSPARRFLEDTATDANSAYRVDVCGEAPLVAKAAPKEKAPSKKFAARRPAKPAGLPTGIRSVQSEGGGRITQIGAHNLPNDAIGYGWTAAGRLVLYYEDGRLLYAD